jgi:3-dehydroquinate dehydratase type I
MVTCFEGKNKQFDDLISQRYTKDLKTYIITLNFSDFSLIFKGLIDNISYGGDLFEFRADLLQDASAGETAIPSLEYVKIQLQILQQLTTLPILFTVRKVSRGGKFPDGAAQEALDLMKLAVTLGCKYIDVEITWPSSTIIESILAANENSTIVASYHELSGNVRWTSQQLQNKCLVAEAIGGMLPTSSRRHLIKKFCRYHKTLCSSCGY